MFVSLLHWNITGKGYICHQDTFRADGQSQSLRMFFWIQVQEFFFTNVCGITALYLHSVGGVINLSRLGGGTTCCLGALNLPTLVASNYFYRPYPFTYISLEAIIIIIIIIIIISLMKSWQNATMRYYFAVLVKRKIVVVDFSQPTAFRCWFSRALTGPTSSTVRGRSLKSGSTTLEATTGSATICCTSWPKKLATNCGVSSRPDRMASSTWQITTLFSSDQKPTTTRLEWPAIPATQATRWATTMGWCSQPTTEKMIQKREYIGSTAHSFLRVVSGTTAASEQAWL